MKRSLATAVLSAVVLLLLAIPASATPVCTDGYKEGPPLAACGGRVFPEAQNTLDYVQMVADPNGFAEYRHGLEYLAKLYPRWISITTLRDRYGEDAVSAGPDGKRSTDPADSGDGHDIVVVKVTDHEVPDAGKQTMLFSLSIHGDEKGGIEGGVRAVEDLAMAAEKGGKITDGVAGYPSATGREPKFHSHEVKDVLAKEAVYFVDFNADGWRRGDHFAPTPGLYTRANQIGTDLNRQMPTVGSINTSRNPLEEPEMLFRHKLMHEVAAVGVGGRMAYGADVHGEGQSRAWVDIMYPAGQFDSVKHRPLGHRVGHARLHQYRVRRRQPRRGAWRHRYGLRDRAEPLGHDPSVRPSVGCVAAGELHQRPRAIVKTAMAYALYQDEEFADFTIDPRAASATSTTRRS